MARPADPDRRLAEEPLGSPAERLGVTVGTDLPRPVVRSEGASYFRLSAKNRTEDQRRRLHDEFTIRANLA